MKNLLLIPFFIFFFDISLFGQTHQSAFYDAKFLKDNCFDKSSKSFIHPKNLKALFKTYFKITDSTSNEDLVDSLKTNPFFADYTPENFAGSVDLANVNYKNLSFSSISSLNITSIADGLAQFLIKRGKEELNVAFFSQFKQFLEKHEECKILFPNTVDLLGKIDSYKYATFLENLRSAFQTDLSNLIIHLNQVIDLTKYATLMSNHREIKLVVGMANVVSELSQSGKNIMPDSIIKQLAVLPWGDSSKNLSSSLKFLNLISESIRASSPPAVNVSTSSGVLGSLTALNSNSTANNLAFSKTWVSLSELNTNLFADSITLRIFLGLIYQQAKSQNIAFYGKKSSIRLDALMAAQKNNIFRLSGLIQNFSLFANDVENSIEDIKAKKANGKLNDEAYYTYINKAINLIDYGFKLPSALSISQDLKKEIIRNKYVAIARDANFLYKNIYTKNYNSAVMNVSSILDSLLPGDSSKKIIAGILKYGTFMASVVKAESPEAVQSAIEASALPAGSSSIKKNSSFNISLNAYIGGYFGRSIDDKIDMDGNNSEVGITAPVGIAFSWGLGHFKNGASIGSLSAYATLIDVGAIAGFRLNNDSTALDQKVTIGDIFAPGGYIVYGIGSPFKFLSYVPISVGYGWHYGSRLYNKVDGKLSISNNTRWRSNWFVGVDIPLTNFWTRNFRK